MDTNNPNQQINPSESTILSTEKPVNDQRKFFPIILGILVLLIIVSGGASYLGTKKNSVTPENNKIDNVLPTSQQARSLNRTEETSSPMTTPIFKTNDKSTSKVASSLHWEVFKQDDENNVNNTMLFLKNKNEEDMKFIGNGSLYGGNVTITSDETKVLFINTSLGREDSLNEALVIYSLSQSTTIKEVTLQEIKQAINATNIPRNASLGYLTVSPSATKAAMSYGYPLEGDFGSNIIIVDLNTFKITSINNSGLVYGWVDENTLQYQVIDLTRSPAQEGYFPEPVIQEVRVQ